MDDFTQKIKMDDQFLPWLQTIIREEYHYLSAGNGKEAKQGFIHGQPVNFSYSRVNELDLRTHRGGLHNITSQISSSQLPDAAKALYHAKAQEQAHTIDLLAAVSNKDDQAFHATSCDLYGTPSETLYWHTIDRINRRFRSLISKVDRKRRTLHQAYGVWSEFFAASQKPARIGAFSVPSYEGIYIPYDDEIDSAEKIRVMFVSYLEELEILDWRVIIDEAGARTAFSVDQVAKVVRIPHESDLGLRRGMLTKQYLKALLSHEIGVHVLRRERGEASELGLLGIGLADYLRGEEGVATFAEQLITGTDSYAGEIGYLAIGTSMGVLSKPLNFEQLFSILNAYFILNIANNALDENGFYELDELRLQAYNSAWNRAVRTFRGTTGNTPGAVYTRDIVYLEGNRGVWKLSDDDPQVKEAWLIGKYDPCNQSHVANLKALGLL